MKYIHYFKTLAEYNAFLSGPLSDFNSPNVCVCEELPVAVFKKQVDTDDKVLKLTVVTTEPNERIELISFSASYLFGSWDYNINIIVIDDIYDIILSGNKAESEKFITFATPGIHTVKIGFNKNIEQWENMISSVPQLIGIEFPDCLRHILNKAALNVHYLQHITFGSHITSISIDIATYSQLSTVTVKALTPPTVDIEYLEDDVPPFPMSNDANIKVYVPAEAINAYKTTGKWKNWADKIFAIGTQEEAEEESE